MRRIGEEPAFGALMLVVYAILAGGFAAGVPLGASYGIGQNLIYGMGQAAAMFVLALLVFIAWAALATLLTWVCEQAATAPPQPPADPPPVSADTET